MKTKEATENRVIRGTKFSRRLSTRSRRYKKLTSREDVEDREEVRPFFSTSQEKNTQASTEDFDEFVANRCKGAREAGKFNSVALEGEDETDRGKETLPARCRRYAICEEMERNIRNEAGVSLRGYREILVTRRLLYEMHLL